MILSEMTAVAALGTGFFTFECARYVALAGMWALILWLGRKWTAPRKIQSRHAVWADYLREWRGSFVSLIMYTLVAIGVMQLMSMGVIRAVAPPSWPVLIGELFLMAVAQDAYFYWTHRWLHRREMFRRVHMHHHMSRVPTVWSGYSFSWFEGLVQAGFVPLWLLVVPFDEISMTLFFMHQLTRNVIGHSGYELAWPGFSRSWLTGWITTTTHHDLHHSGGNHNFGLYFTWWDRWMGTEHPDYHARFEKAAKPWLPRHDMTAPDGQDGDPDDLAKAA